MSLSVTLTLMTEEYCSISVAEFNWLRFWRDSTAWYSPLATYAMYRGDPLGEKAIILASFELPLTGVRVR